MPDALTRRRKAPWTKGQAVSFPEGANLFEEASHARRIYLLNAGLVRLTGRKGVIFDHVNRGAFVGEKFLLPGVSDNHAATVLSAVEAIAFRKSELMAEWRHNPEFALKLVKDLAMRLDRYEELICDLVTEKAEARLARLLLRTAPPHPATGWVRLPFRFTNVELARMVGTTRWRISHLLNRFQRLGWLRREDRIWLRRDGALDYLASK